MQCCIYPLEKQLHKVKPFHASL